MNCPCSRCSVAVLVSVSVTVALLLLAFFSSSLYAEGQIGGSMHPTSSAVEPHRGRPFVGAASNRKLLRADVGGVPSSLSTSSSPKRTDRIGDQCSKDDIVVHQGATSPMPNGIPTYTVEILNLCAAGEGACSMAHIHLSCGWFSSARLINPRVFRRLSYDDCLLNDGRPLPPGSSLSFQYANSFRYPLSVASASCAP